MSYLTTLKGTTGDAFNKLAEDAQKQLEKFEAEIRADEREKVIDELIEKGILKKEQID
jgi:hypothetical protein